MKIVMVSSEMTPFARGGWMGEAVGGLARELAALGQEVFCLVPYYRCAWERAEATPTGMSLTVPIGQKQVTAAIWQRPPAKQQAGEGVLRIFFVRRDEYFDRSELYRANGRDYEDNAERFIFFSKIAVEWIRVCELYPTVVHSHGWQTALVPLLLRLQEQAHSMRIASKTVFTLYDLTQQGVFWSLDFPMTNLPWQFFSPEGIEFYGQMNLLKAGILFSDLLTTVSPRYASEIQSPQQGGGLENTIRARADRLHGILHGLDYEDWDPARDAHLARPYSAADLGGKQACKRALLSEFGLDREETKPLAALVSPLGQSSGHDILAEALDSLLEQGLRLALLGRGEPAVEQFWRDAAKRYRGRVGVCIEEDEAGLHRLTAGADLLLLPSRSAPCAADAMRALRYGTVPVVRAMDGLEETVESFDARSGTGTGFKFPESTAAALTEAVREAVAVYQQPDRWQQLLRNGMTADFSWRAPATHYRELYEKG